MPKVQIDMADTKYAETLREALSKDWAFSGWQVQRVQSPDLQQKGVIVLDTNAFDRLEPMLAHPERVVLIAPNDPRRLSRAWDAGIDSVVFEKDPLSTLMMAILAARFRAHRSRPKG